MLEIVTEFSKGILFVRLIGSLDKKTVSKLNEEVTFLVKKSGFKNIVFNIENLEDIDIKGAYSFLYNYELAKSNKGKVYICGIRNNRVSLKLKKLKIFNYLKKEKDEYSILNKEEVF